MRPVAWLFSRRIWLELIALKNCQRLWGDYAAAEAELLSSEVAGGTMYSMIYASHKMELTKARNAQLRQLRDRKEGDC
ncbi:MAG: hypothetical protein B7Y73_07200 [Acidocella sp. 35-58-6]|nr:MAG: hypothetical protein B7Y73_07200 [Acidocella sp. 35-58-6]